MLHNPKWEKPDLSKPSLTALAYALRHRERWPEGFVWDFGCYGSCAWGLARQLWDFKEPHDLDERLRTEGFYEIFIKGACSSPGQVTPEIIATRIDNYLQVRVV